MHKITLTLIILSLIIPSIALGQGLPVPDFEDPGSIEGLTQEAGLYAGYNVSGDKETGLASIVGAVVRTFLSLLGVIFISYTVYGGYLWMTAAGNEERITKSKSILRQGIIGLIIILSSAAIYILVLNIFFDTSGGSPPILTT